MQVEAGQLRKWRFSTPGVSELFLVVDVSNESIGPWVTYVQDGRPRYDDESWVADNSDVINESR